MIQSDKYHERSSSVGDSKTPHMTYNTMINPKKAPYHGQLLMTIFMILPSLFLTVIFYEVMSYWQPSFGDEINWAGAKMFGCGIGALFHISCWICGAFSKDFRIVKNRLKQFFEDLPISLKLALRWYFEDIRANGIAFWIDLAIIAANIWLCADGILDFIRLFGG